MNEKPVAEWRHPWRLATLIIAMWTAVIWLVWITL